MCVARQIQNRKPTDQMKRKREEWTAKESDALYDAVARFSKARIADIARHVGSKSPLDVLARIHFLDRALAEAEALGLVGPESDGKHAKYDAVESPAARIEAEERESEESAQREDRELREAPQTFITKEMRAQWKKPMEIFNLHMLAVLAERVYVRHSDTAIQRDALLELYDALARWLRQTLAQVVFFAQARKPRRQRVQVSEDDVRDALEAMPFPNRNSEYYISHLLWTGKGRRAFNAHYGVNLDSLGGSEQLGVATGGADSIEEQNLNSTMAPWHETNLGRVGCSPEPGGDELSAAIVVEDDTSSDSSMNSGPPDGLGDTGSNASDAD